MAAQLSIVSRNGSSDRDVEEDFVMMMDEKPANYRSVTMSVSASPVIAIRSLSSTKQTVAVDCLGSGGKSGGDNVSVGPNQTLLVACLDEGPRQIRGFAEIPERENAGTGAPANRAVALSVTSSVSSMELAAFGFSFRSQGQKGVQSAIPFVDVNGLLSSTAIYPGVPTGRGTAFGWQTFTLQAALANFGGQPRKATILVSTGHGPGSAQRPGATLTVPPHNVSVVTLEDPPDDAMGVASLVVQTDAAPGEVLSDIQAVSTPGGAGPSLTLPWKDQRQPFNGGQHPWRIDAGISSVVLLFNADQQTANSVTLSAHADGKTWTKRVPVPPLATVSVRLNDIIDKQEPDDKGTTLPRTSTRGLVTWFTLTNPKVFGQLIQADVVGGVVRPFACAQSQAVCGAQVQNLSLTAGQTGDTNALALICGSNLGDCGCVEQCGASGNATFSGWVSEDTSIASLVSSSTSSATFQGNTAGTTFSDVTVTDNNLCSSSGGGSISVSPSVTGISPSMGVAGTSTSVTISGAGFGSSPTVNVTGGINVSINSANNNQITATLDVPGTTPGGNQTLTVTANSRTSLGISFFVQIPTFFRGNDHFPASPCDTGQDGVNTSVFYQVLDQTSTVISKAGMTPLEKAPGTGGLFKTFASPPTTDVEGKFTDTPVGTCFSASPPPPAQVCVDVQQLFQLQVNTTVYPITTVTNRRECGYPPGQRLTADPPSFTFTIGTVT
jgi:hypothetical protein